MEGTSFMLDDDMVRLLDKFQDDTYNLRYSQVYNYHYILTILEAIFVRIQIIPDRFSYKDFETVNKIVKLIIDIQRELTTNTLVSSPDFRI